MSCNFFVVCHALPTANNTNLQVQTQCERIAPVQKQAYALVQAYALLKAYAC